jgi:hypothetical protein
MVSLNQLRSQFASGQLDSLEYQVQTNLNLYDSSDLESLATQAVVGRHLHFLSLPQVFLDSSHALQVCLCEDGYPGWLNIQDLALIQEATTLYQPPSITRTEIQERLPQVIAFTRAAMTQPNFYLWGGTVGPNYDCSGLVQQAFCSQGIWLPRDAYQQEAFTQPIPNPSDNPADLIPNLLAGDLIFFGTPQKATHVGIYLGDGFYIHSSGKEQGRNGIGIEQLSAEGDNVSQAYYKQVRGAGRVISSYQP